MSRASSSIGPIYGEHTHRATVQGLLEIVLLAILTCSLLLPCTTCCYHIPWLFIYRKQYQVTFKGLISKFISDVSKNSLLFSAMFAFFLFSFFKSFLLTINDSFIPNYLRLTLKHNLFQFIIENCFKL